MSHLCTAKADKREMGRFERGNGLLQYCNGVFSGVDGFNGCS